MHAWDGGRGVYTNACFSSSLSTSSWLLSLATSIAVFPSRFCSVLHFSGHDLDRQQAS
jgi:hypothetical protein